MDAMMAVLSSPHNLRKCSPSHQNTERWDDTCKCNTARLNMDTQRDKINRGEHKTYYTHTYTYTYVRKHIWQTSRHPEIIFFSLKKEKILLTTKTLNVALHSFYPPHVLIFVHSTLHMIFIFFITFFAQHKFLKAFLIMKFSFKLTAIWGSLFFLPQDQLTSFMCFCCLSSSLVVNISW